MNNEIEEEKPGQEIVFERVWTDAHGSAPNIEDVIADVQEAFERAFQSPGKLTIRAARRNC